MVRANLDKEKAEDDAKEYRRQYDQLSEKITSVREKKANLLSSAELPLPDLSVKEGELVYKGQKWDNMSGSERLMVSTAIGPEIKSGVWLCSSGQAGADGSADTAGVWFLAGGRRAAGDRYQGKYR